MPPAGFEPPIPFSERPQTHALGYGLHWSKKQHNTTQQSGQTPDKEVEIKNITVYISGYTETDTTGMLSPPTVWRQQSEFVSSRQCGQYLLQCAQGSSVVTMDKTYGHACRIKCNHTCLRCMPRQMLVCCVVSVLSPM